MTENRSVESKATPMTPRRLLKLLGNAKSAQGFLEAHRVYLTTGEVAPITSPILAMVDARHVMPTPALAEIQAAVWVHIMAKDLSKAEASLVKSDGEEKEPPPFEARILDEVGNVQFRTTDSGEEKELIAGFKMPQDAERWCNRQLDAGAPGWHGEVTWFNCPEKLSDFRVRVISRDNAIQAMLRKGPGPVMHVTKVGAGGLGFGCKVKQSVAKFSRG